MVAKLQGEVTHAGADTPATQIGWWPDGSAERHGPNRKSPWMGMPSEARNGPLAKCAGVRESSWPAPSPISSAQVVPWPMESPWLPRFARDARPAEQHVARGQPGGSAILARGLGRAERRQRVSGCFGCRLGRRIHGLWQPGESWFRRMA